MEQSFFIHTLIYLGSAVVMVPIAKRLGLGSVLGYLIAGLLIGPYALSWVGEEGGDIMQFAEMGVVMMLFLIGLDLEPRSLWRLRRDIAGMGGLQVALTALVVTLLVYYLPLGLSTHQGIALGLIFAMSSTAIVLQTMAENNWMQTEAGNKAFSVLLFQDIAVILIIAILPLLGSGEMPTGGADGAKTEFLSQFVPWARTLVVFGAIALIIIAGRYLARPLFQMVAATNLRELFSATALLLVVGISVLMSLVGLSPALGAFLAGVVLANSEYKHELEGDIEPFKGLLLGLFFVSVGVSINFDVIANNPLLVVVSVLCVMVLKLLVLVVLGKLFKMRRQQNLLFSFSLAQVGEFAFVLFAFSEKQDIFNKELFDLLMVIVAVSMAFSPIFMVFLDKVWMRHVFNRFNKAQEAEKSAVLGLLGEQTIPDGRKVIIAGYGRFGSVIGRFLKVNGVASTILDTDSDRVEILRRNGVEAFYGDALRLDLLNSIGADQASLFVVALNDRLKVLRLVKLIKSHFPEAHIVARAHGQREAYELMDAGVLHVYRETLDTSIRAGKDALTILGVDEDKAQRALNIFLEHDEKTIKSLAAARFDEKEYYRLIRSETDHLQLMIENDLEELEKLELSIENELPEKDSETFPDKTLPS